MTIQTTEFNASELCSRKLWQLVNTDTRSDDEDFLLQQAIQELMNRRHYLAELSRMGKLESTSHNA